MFYQLVTHRRRVRAQRELLCGRDSDAMLEHERILLGLAEWWRKRSPKAGVAPPTGELQLGHYSTHSGKLSREWRKILWSKNAVGHGR